LLLLINHLQIALSKMSLSSTDEATHDLAKVAVDQAKAARDSAEGLREQLQEMKAQRLLTIAQLRASLSREQPPVNAIQENGTLARVGEITGFAISPTWRNVGNTNAKDFRAWFELKRFDIISAPKNLSGKDCPPLRIQANCLPPSRFRRAKMYCNWRNMCLSKTSTGLERTPTF
jgi:hypothetical protein